MDTVTPMAWLAVITMLGVLVALLLGPLARANELFVLEIRRSGLTIVRGRLPGRLHDELAEVIQRGRVHSGRIRVFTRDRKPAVAAEGVPADILQRVRNVVGMFRVAEIRAGARRPAGIGRRPTAPGSG